MFLGCFEHSIDSKNRLRLPSKFKKDFASQLILTKGNGGCVLILPKENFDTVFKKATELPMFDESAQRPLRLLLLPNSLKTHAKIVKNVVFVGVGQRLELWAKESWEKYSNTINFDEILKELGRHGV